MDNKLDTMFRGGKVDNYFKAFAKPRKILSGMVDKLGLWITRF